MSLSPDASLLASVLLQRQLSEPERGELQGLAEETLSFDRFIEDATKRASPFHQLATLLRIAGSGASSAGDDLASAFEGADGDDELEVARNQVAHWALGEDPFSGGRAADHLEALAERLGDAGADALAPFWDDADAYLAPGPPDVFFDAAGERVVAFTEAGELRVVFDSGSELVGWLLERLAAHPGR